MEKIDLSDTPLATQPKHASNSKDLYMEEGPPDPRIQVELEILNTSTDLINKLEVDLDEARMLFRQTLTESTQTIDTITKRLGKCIDQARPYYDARIKHKQILSEAKKSAVWYDKAVSEHAAAREMVQLAEEGFLSHGCIFDSTWQEMLNHATTKVNNAEKEKIVSTVDHEAKSGIYHESENRVKFLQKELKRAITKSSLNARRSLMLLSNIVRMQELQLLPYFELKATVNHRLEQQKCHVKKLEVAVSCAKTNYSEALSSLEVISDQIHKNRKQQLAFGIRGIGVGAESPGSLLRSTLMDSRIISRPSEPSEEPETVTNIVVPCEEGEPLNKTNDLNSELSGWQFVVLPSTTSDVSQLLVVDDKESVPSDSESLASMEMLSEDVIANLMLEDEINEAMQHICNPSDEFLSPPNPSSTATTWEMLQPKGRPRTLPVSPSYCSSNSSGPSSPEAQAYSLLCDTPDPNVVNI